MFIKQCIADSMAKEFEAIESIPIPLGGKEVRTSYTVLSDRYMDPDNPTILGEKVIILEVKELPDGGSETKRIYCKVTGVQVGPVPVEPGQKIELLCKKIKK